MQDLGQLTKGYPPKAYSAMDILKELKIPENPIVLDLGCGNGRMFERLETIIPSIKYIGVDIADSDEVLSRERSDLQFMTFDGVNIELPAETCDLVFCNQVFEHVRHPDLLLKNVHRVLKKGGLFVGSLSGLEPYHSRSIFNLTPYGWLLILNENNLKATTIRPGVDCSELIARQFKFMTGSDISLTPKTLFQEISNLSINDLQKVRLMLHFAGHISFAAYK